MTRLLFFVGSPLTSTALFYRAGVLAQHLDKNRFETMVVSVADRREDVGRTLTMGGLPIRTVGVGHYLLSDGQKTPLSPVQYALEVTRTLRRVAAVARDFQPDIVQTFSSLPVSLFVAWRARRKYRVVADVDDLLVAQARATATSRLTLKLLELVELGIPRRLQHVTVNSRYLNTLFPRAVRIPNMIRVADFQLTLGAAERNAIKARYGIDEATIAFVSTVTLYHGHFEILDAIAKGNRKFVFVGGGEGEARLRDAIRRQGLEDRIVCTGHLPHAEVIRILNVVRVGILPMSNSPVHLARHPLKLLEYMASGLCVVASKVGEAEELLRDGTGVLVAPGDMDALIRAACAVTNPEHYSRAAVATVQRFDVARITRDWEDLYARVLQTA